MNRNNYPGKFIVLEGLDGSGLSTQADLLTNLLNEEKKGLTTNLAGAVQTKEPTRSLIGGLVNAQLDGSWSSSNACLQLLFSADRSYHLENKIIPLLEKGVWVVCDRYFFSTIAFGQLNGVDEEWLLTLQKYFLMPDITFFLEVSPEECIRRINDNRFRVELFEKRRVLSEVWDNYRRLADRFKEKNVFIVDGEQTIDGVFNDIKKITKKVLKI